MRTIVYAALAALAAGLANTALGHPDGAPWGAALPATGEDCASCHFGSEAVYDSEALSVHGLPAAPAAGDSYQLTIRFDDPEAVVAGFQLIAQADSEQAGDFSSRDPNLEYVGAAIRSTAPTKDTDGIAWSVEWTAPEPLPATIAFYVAASAANDDQSPFGDTIHFRTYLLPKKR